MQIHIQLIPISNTDQPPPSPDLPEHVYHYTTGTRLKQIINSGAIKRTTAKIEPHEKPVAWFSTSPEWEPTATKVPVPGMAGQIATAKSQSGLVRIRVPGTCAPYIFPQLPLIAGTKPSVCIGLLAATRTRGDSQLSPCPCASSARSISTTSPTTSGWLSIWPSSPAATDFSFPLSPPKETPSVFTALFLCTLLAIDLAVVCFAFGCMSGYRRAFAERAMTQTY